MKAVVLLAMLLLPACAVIHVRYPDGCELTGITAGHSHIRDCRESTGLVQTANSGEDETVSGNCIDVEGGTLSSTVSSIIGTMGTVLMAAFSMGVL